MARAYQLFGEFMVYVSGHYLGNTAVELGLTQDQVTLVPTFYHRDIGTDGFGPNVPVETLWNMGECLIYMTLVNFDAENVGKCWRASMGGGSALPNASGTADGFLGPAGRSLGGGLPLTNPANYYTTLHLVPASAVEAPFRFYACYLNSKPLELSLGTQRTVVRLGWRCVPYQPLYVSGGVPQEITGSGGAILFDHVF